jgi:hypothetical protein
MGHLEYEGASVNGGGPNGKAAASVVIIMDHPLLVPVKMKQPDRTDVIFLQEGNSFRMIPANAPVVGRMIEIKPFNNGRQTTEMTELPSGAKSGGGGISWSDLEIERLSPHKPDAS